MLGSIASILATWSLHMGRKLEKDRLEFEKKKIAEEMKERDKIAAWRRKEERRFLSIGSDIAEHVSRHLMDEPTWAHNALYSAKFLSYRDTVFETRLEHFREQKEELAEKFVPLPQQPPPTTSKPCSRIT